MPTDENVETLYRVFSVYRRKLSPATMSADEDLEAKKRLKQTPLRQLSADDALAVTAFCDDLRDLRSLKHFLPRLLEIGLHPGRGALLGVVKVLLEAARWRTWPEKERAAIEHCPGALGCSDHLCR